MSRSGNRARRTSVVGAALAIAGLALCAPAAYASSVFVDGSQLEIQGDADADAITVSVSGNTLTVRDTGSGGATTADVDCTQVNPTTVTCPTTLGSNEVVGFFVSLGAGTDSFTNQNFETQFGQIQAFNQAGIKTVVGGPGPQFIGGGLASDDLNGGAGDDQLNDGSGESGSAAGNDTLVGGPGTDSAGYFRDTGVNLSLSLDGVANDGQPGESDNVQVENLASGNGNDTLIGDATANTLQGLGGNDLISGLDGNDELFGDTNQSQLARGFGGTAGDDILDGGQGRDAFRCGNGIDVALREPLDLVDNDCERIGVAVVGDSAQLRGKKKNKFKVELSCPASEPESCSGKLKITAADKKVGKGKFSIGPGKSRGANARLSKRGAKAVRRAGGALFVTVEAQTTEPGGIAIDAGRILIHT
jgi:hypothetical protein